MKDRIETTIDYADADGQITRRRVKISSISSSRGRTYVNGYCMERKAPRQFRLDRIDCFITEEGECVEPATFISKIKNKPVAENADGSVNMNDPRQSLTAAQNRKRPWTGRRIVNTIFGTYTVLLVLFCFAAPSFDELVLVFTGMMLPAALLWGIGRWLTKPKTLSSR